MITGRIFTIADAKAPMQAPRFCRSLSLIAPLEVTPTQILIGVRSTISVVRFHMLSGTPARNAGTFAS
jgi:hypothetical protein